MKTSDKRLLKTLLSLDALLLIPLIGMQVSNEVNWTLFDFLSMGLLLLGLSIMIELVLRIVNRMAIRIVLIAIVVLLFLLTWAELAVGVFGTPFAGS